MAYKQFTEKEKAAFAGRQKQTVEEMRSTVRTALDNFQSHPEQLAEALTFGQQFYQYSLGNSLLIQKANHHAEYVASYEGWKKLGYSVKKGAKAIKILASVEAIFYEDGTDANGVPIYKRLSELPKEERAKIDKNRLIKKTVGHKPGNVFDISETTCPTEDYPKIFNMGYSSEMHKTVYEALKKAAEDVYGIRVAEKDLESISLRGQYVPYGGTYGSIETNHLLNDTQKLDTFAHEFGHALMLKFHPEESGKNISIREFEADAISLMLQSRFGIDVSHSQVRIDHLKEHYDKCVALGKDFNLKKFYEEVSKVYDKLIADVQPVVDQFVAAAVEVTNQKENEQRETEAKSAVENRLDEQSKNERKAEHKAAAVTAAATVAVGAAAVMRDEVPHPVDHGAGYEVYQLKSDENLHDYRFATFQELTASGLTVSSKNYESVYAAPLEVTGNTAQQLETLFTQLNANIPPRYHGHSLSVSDVIVITKDGEKTVHYVDRTGFQDIPEKEWAEIPFEDERLAAEEEPIPIIKSSATQPYSDWQTYRDCMGGLRNKLKNPPQDIKNKSFNFKDGYEEGLRRAMSIVSSYYNPLKQAVSKAEPVSISDLEQADIAEAAERQNAIDNFNPNNYPPDVDAYVSPEETHDLPAEDAFHMAQKVLAENNIDPSNITVTRAKSYRPLKNDGTYHVLLEYTGNTPENDVFNLLHETELNFADGTEIDVNPITPGKSGTIEEYLEHLETLKAEPVPITGNELATDKKSEPVPTKKQDKASEKQTHYHFYYKDDYLFTADGKDAADLALDDLKTFYRDTLGYPWENDGKVIENENWHVATGRTPFSMEVLEDHEKWLSDNAVPNWVQQPIYSGGFAEAHEKDEVEQWRASSNIIQKCARQFNKQYENAYNQKKLPEFLNQMVNQYGIDRCKIVLASTIQLSAKDGRYDAEAKEAASKVFIPGKIEDDYQRDSRELYRVNCHPVTVNAAFHEILKMEQNQQSEQKSVAVAENASAADTKAESVPIDTTKQATEPNIAKAAEVPAPLPQPQEEQQKETKQKQLHRQNSHNSDNDQYNQWRDQLVNNIDILDVASRLGYTVKRVGNKFSSITEHDSVRFYPNNTYVRESVPKGAARRGGTTIDFVKNFNFDDGLGLRCSDGTPVDEAKGAMKWLSENFDVQLAKKFDYSSIPESTARAEFKLPPKAENPAHVAAYLHKTRGIDSKTISEILERGLLYEEKSSFHNAIFVGVNKDGERDFANHHTTLPSSKFKGDVGGSNEKTGWYVENNSDKLYVTEAPIDAMSLMSVKRMDGENPDDANYLATCSTAKLNILYNRLIDSPNIKTVVFAMDKDDPGQKAIQTAVNTISQKFPDITCKKYELPVEGGKDVNDYLQYRNSQAKSPKKPEQQNKALTQEPAAPEI